MPKNKLWFAEHLKAQGYATEGIGCYGLSHMAMQACLAGRISEFDARIELLRQTSSQELTQILANTDYAKTPMLSSIPAFFDGAVLMDKTYLFPQLFTEENLPLKQEAVQALNLISSLALSAQGGVVDKGNFTGLYQHTNDIDELQIYFSTLQKRIMQYGLPCSLVLISGKHAITIGYDRGWIFFNPATLKTKRGLSTNELAAHVLKAFSSNHVATFTTSMWTTGKNNFTLTILIEKWLKDLNDPKLQNINKITSAKASLTDSLNTSWLYVAAQSNDLHAAQELLTHIPNPDIAHEDGTTPLFVAIQNHHAQLADLLLKRNANPHFKNAKGLTPFVVAEKSEQQELTRHMQNDFMPREMSSPRHSVHHQIGFNTVEHEKLGADIVLLDIHNEPITKLEIYKVDGTTLTAPHELLAHVTFSQLVGLPDYYALHKGAISNFHDEKQTPTERMNNFVNAFNQLSVPQNLEEKVADIDKIARQHDDEYINSLKDVECCGLGYLQILGQNYDHFAPDAWQAYQAGHQKALQMAQIAYQYFQGGDQVNARKYLHTAYSMEGYANHYTTDNFSAGHMRTPRRALVEKFGSFLGGALSNSMHDEDCFAGVEVQNNLGEKWKSYGDGYLNDDNEKIITNLLLASTNEIFSTFKTGIVPQPENFAAKLFLPKSLDDLNRSLDVAYQFDGNNQLGQAPLFIAKNGKIYTRADLNDRNNYTYDELHLGHSIFEAIRLRFPYHYTNQNAHANSADHALGLFRESLQKIQDKFAGYSSVCAFFKASQDSKQAAIKLKSLITDATTEKKLFLVLAEFINENPHADKLLEDLRRLTKNYLVMREDNTSMNTKNDLFYFFAHRNVEEKNLVNNAPVSNATLQRI